jgi:hypothetical protein
MTIAVAALLETYADGRLLWEAKGWPMEGVAAELATDGTLAAALAAENLKVDLSQAALSRKSLAGTELPRPVAEAIVRLETRPKREHLTELVVAGLRVLRGEPAGREPRELALALFAHFPTDEFAVKFAEAVSNQVGVSPGGSLLDSLGRAIADRLPHVLKRSEAKLARQLARRLDRLTVRRAVQAGAAGGVGGAVVGCAVLGVGVVAFVAMLLSGRLQIVNPAPEAAKATEVGRSHEVASNVTQPPVIIVHVAEGSAPVVFDLQALLSAIATGEIGVNEMGEKPKPIDNPVPSKPLLPYQKAPPCLGEAGEKPINGGCWTPIADMKPPCGRYLFRHEDKCYRAVAADPTNPVGQLPR